ncbi:hypothetical protein CR513_14808, partial [Mucuna pruriens]
MSNSTIWKKACHGKLLLLPPPIKIAGHLNRYIQCSNHHRSQTRGRSRDWGTGEIQEEVKVMKMITMKYETPQPQRIELKLYSSVQRWHLRTIQHIIVFNILSRTMLPITFTDVDFVGVNPNQDDPMIIIVEVVNLTVMKMLIDQKRARVDIKGYVNLLTTFGTVTRSALVVVHYIIVEAFMSYNILIGTLDQRTLIEKVKIFWLINLIDQNTKLNTQLSKTKEVELGNLLLKNVNLFAWCPSNMPSFDPKFLSQKLAICDKAKPIAQKKRKFGKGRRKVVCREIEKLLVANFIREMEYPTLLANVMLVKKANGKWQCVPTT